MISAETEALILRLHHAERWPPTTIARQVGVHYTTVRRVLAQAGQPEPRKVRKPSIADPYLPFIRETLAKYPELPASRLHQMVVERGYPGGPDHFRSIVSRLRPRKPAEAFLKLRTLPGEQAQVDWGHFGRLEVGRSSRPLMAFVMVLSWSRWLFVQFSLDARMGSFLRGHEAAFRFFGGVPRVLLYDNLKSVVLERRADATRFNPTLVASAGHHRFEPRPVAPYRGNEKARVERAIRYLRTSFFTAREFDDVEDLNRQARQWCQLVAGRRRCPEDRTLTVEEAGLQEKDKLLALPDDAFPTHDRVEARVGKVPYVRFDGNDYTVPHDRVRRTVVVLADHDTVRVLDGTVEVARHRRSWSRGEQVEDPAHIATLVAEKRRARQHRGLDRLTVAAPSSPALMQAVAERGGNLGSVTAQLLRLLESHGAAELEAAIAEALADGAPHVQGVRQVLQRRRTERQQPPAVAVRLPDDERVRGLVVHPHRLSTYDAIDHEGGPA